MSNATWVNHPCPAGVRKTSAADTLSFDVQAVSTLAADVDRVEFQVLGPGGLNQTLTVSSRSLRFPNFSDYGSRLPGSLPGFMAPIYCYGVTLLCGNYPVGIITVIAKVYYSSGSPADILTPVKFVNDWDGSDLRYSTKIIHVRGQTGNDTTGDGSPGNPVKSLNKAISLCRANPSGSPLDSAAMNCGGAEIVVGEAVVGCGSGTGFAWHTGEQWLTVRMLPGASFVRDLVGGDNFIVCSGISDVGDCSIRWSNFTVRGYGPILHGGGYPTSNIRITQWWEWTEHTSIYYNPANPWSVRHFENDGPMWGISGVTSVAQNAKTFVTGLWRHHCGNGIDGFTQLYDFIIEDYIAVALQSVGYQSDSALCGIIRNQEMQTQNIRGLARTVGGANFLVTEPSPGLMKIEATAQLYHYNLAGTSTGEPTNIATQLAELVGTTYYQVHLTSFGSNSGIFPVVAVGSTPGGNPYVTLDTGGSITIVPGTAPSGALLQTGRAGPNSAAGQAAYIWDPHPDIVQWWGDRVRPFFAHIRAEAIKQSQGFFLSGNVDRLALLDVTDGGHGLRCPFGWTLTDCYLGHCSLTGSWDWNPGSLNSGKITNCVVNNLNGVSAGVILENNHIIQSSGAFYQYPTTSIPYSFEPLVARQGTGTTTLCPPEWYWPSSGNLPSIGCFKSVGIGNWASGSLPSGDISFTSSDAFSVSPSKLIPDGTSFSNQATLSVDPRQIYTSAVLLFGDTEFLVRGLIATFVVGEVRILSATSALSIAGVVSTPADLSFWGDSGFVLSAVSTGQTVGTVVFAGDSILTASSTKLEALVVNLAPSTIPTLMKQRIHNALTAAVLAGPYYRCSVDPKTGQMTIDLNKPVELTKKNLKVSEKNKSFRLAEHFKRSYNTTEMRSWIWIVQVEFPAIEVACEVFEENLQDTGIQIPPIVGLPNQRRLLARLRDCDYFHPPSQSPDTGTVAEFTFEIATELLRK